MTQQGLSGPMARLIDELNKLPGIGPKSAQRLAYHLLRASQEQAQELASAILEMKSRSVLCSICQNITEASPCPICSDPGRERAQICVVEEPLDLVALERARAYRGLYHVLHGVISPMDGIGPEQLKTRELLGRLQGDQVQEVIMATNPTLEGDGTALYISTVLAGTGVRITRLARGLPSGSVLEFANNQMLADALDGRRTF